MGGFCFAPGDGVVDGDALPPPGTFTGGLAGPGVREKLVVDFGGIPTMRRSTEDTS
jgi:hypothetical protein